MNKTTLYTHGQGGFVDVKWSLHMCLPVPKALYDQIAGEPNNAPDSRTIAQARIRNYLTGCIGLIEEFQEKLLQALKEDLGSEEGEE